MPQLEAIKTITVDDVPMAVTDLSLEVQQLVGVFNDWNQKEADARSDLMMVSAAKDNLSRQIINTIRTDQEAAAAAAAPAAVDVVAPPVVEEAVAEVAANDEVPEDAVVVTGDGDA